MLPFLLLLLLPFSLIPPPLLLLLHTLPFRSLLFQFRPSLRQQVVDWLPNSLRSSLTLRHEMPGLTFNACLSLSVRLCERSLWHGLRNSLRIKLEFNLSPRLILRLGPRSILSRCLRIQTLSRCLRIPLHGKLRFGLSTLMLFCPRAKGPFPLPQPPLIRMLPARAPASPIRK
ncbi:hypothetical protein L249_4103 [Ophiocordyceps polyrhachis-furcata BCC 54312]|uniref:Uncharacterized protein n=1 Tax=Ophiocordyceps polyrhachis-furcata BCC 54312 TaxID=1330021 RepID=A0A367L534_9HYPO|nr:hypothetical protein L249_4103 [Ophiocordyceps polyrhachis-furcata BCC 54312]